MSLIGRAKDVARWIRWLVRGPQPAILLYHRIVEDEFDPWGLAVAPDRFEAQMDWLARNRSVLPLADFARRHRERSLPRDAIAITFDDGYACNAETAAPILQRLGLPATIFLPAELIEQRREFWWDELQQIVLEHPGDRLSMDGAEVEIGPRSPEDHRWPAHADARTDRQRAFFSIWSGLRPRPPAEIDAVMAGLRRQSEPAKLRPSHLPMSANEIRSAGPTIAFGSHALTHPSLPSLDTATKAREIRDSVARCEAISGHRPATLAYPFGDHDPECEALAEQAGFDCACITGQRFVTADDRPFALPRLQVGDWSAEQLARALAAR